MRWPQPRKQVATSPDSLVIPTGGEWHQNPWHGKHLIPYHVVCPCSNIPKHKRTHTVSTEQFDSCRAMADGLLAEKGSGLSNRFHRTHSSRPRSSGGWYVESTHSKGKKRRTNCEKHQLCNTSTRVAKNFKPAICSRWTHTLTTESFAVRWVQRGWVRGE